MWTRRQFLGTSCTGVAAAAFGVPDVQALSSPAEAPPAERLSAVEAAHGVLERQLGKRASDFHLSTIPYPSDGHDSYELKAEGGKVEVTGTSAVALCRGVYSYLKESCSAMIT